jgi:hypothetical protein
MLKSNATIADKQQYEHRWRNLRSQMDKKYTFQRAVVSVNNAWLLGGDFGLTL